MFNTPDNQDYVRPIPEKKLLQFESIPVSARKEFESWHAEQVEKEVVFDFAKELVEYYIGAVCHIWFTG